MGRKDGYSVESKHLERVRRKRTWGVRHVVDK